MFDPDRKRAWYDANRELTIERARENALANPERTRDTKRRHAAQLSPEKRAQKLARQKEWRAANRERLLVKSRAYDTANRDRKLERQRAYRAANKEFIRAQGFAQKYGVSLDQWQALFDAQDGRCKICGTDDPGGKLNWHTDHCHETGVVRGILCHRCNVGIGHFKDDPSLLRKAVAYLEEFANGDAA